MICSARLAPSVGMDAPDLFLSYNSADRESVVAVQKLLALRGISTFLDRRQLAPGLPWPSALEGGLRGVRAVAVFIGRELGAWQKREMYFALDRQVREEKQGHPFPVIPVLLPGADITPSFLFLNTWIDLRSGIDVAVAEPLEAFERAVATTVAATASAPERTVLFCPYRGLEAFREEDAAFFAGRTAFASELLKFTLGKELVAVVGPSGSGKSSVVQAGLVPLLRRQLPPMTLWDIVTFTPGGDPFHRLASCLAPLLEPELTEVDRLTEAQKLGERLANSEIRLESVIDRVIANSNGTGRLLVVADQFEEIFTLTPEPVRRPFAGALVQALGKARFTLLATLRADFYSQIIALDRELSDRLAPAQINIGALSENELRESIIGPARLVGLEFEPGLVDRILDDVGSEPGNLPLLEFALTRLWSKREGRRFTNDAYDEIGGVTGALAQRADAEFARFGPEEQTAVRRLFSRLVRVARPEEGAEDTRQRIQLQAADPLTDKVAQALARADVRLLVMGRPEGEGQAKGQTVEVAHEALIRNWERLRGWLNEDREFLLWRQRTQIQVDQWERHRRDAGYLLRGLALSDAERWFVGRLQDMMADEQQFIGQSVALREREREAEERRRVSISVVAITVAIVIGVFALVAFQQQRKATRNAAIADARRLTAEAELIISREPARIGVGALLAANAVSRFRNLNLDSPDASEIVTRGLATLLRIERRQTFQSPAVTVSRHRAVFASGGRYFAVSDGGTTVQILDPKGGSTRTVALDGRVSYLAFSFDGRYLLTATGLTTLPIRHCGTCPANSRRRSSSSIGHSARPPSLPTAGNSCYLASPAPRSGTPLPAALSAFCPTPPALRRRYSARMRNIWRSHTGATRGKRPSTLCRCSRPVPAANSAP